VNINNGTQVFVKVNKNIIVIKERIIN